MRAKFRFFWVTVYASAAAGFLVLNSLLAADIFSPLGDQVTLLQRLSHSLALISIILLLRTVVDKLIDRLEHSRGERYNLHRVTRLVTAALVTYVAITFQFKETYTFLTGLGILTLILGFALQAPIASFIAWLYIILRRPYQVGDRIQLSEHRGDVVEINYLDTILEECSGDYLGNDRKSGRLIRFPNSLVLNGKIVNYSGPSLPFIWNETAVQVAYTSDLDFVEGCLLRSSIADFEERYPSRAQQQQWQPDVYFRTSPDAWLEAVISYPVEPQDTTGRRNRILRAALPLMNEEPDKVQFPAGTRR